MMMTTTMMMIIIIIIIIKLTFFENYSSKVITTQNLIFMKILKSESTWRKRMFISTRVKLTGNDAMKPRGIKE